MSPNCGQRRQTTVATQALWFLNDQELIAHADSLAKLLIGQSTEDSQRLVQLHLRLFGERPSPKEMLACEEFLARQRELFTAANSDADANMRALASLCQVMLASNRFLYID